MNTHKHRDLAAQSDSDLIERLRAARSEVGRIVVGQEDVIEPLILGLIGGGHVLIEGAPGLGKTLLVRTLGRVFALTTSRIQFTPDLMPADITGTHVLAHDDQGGVHSRFEPGPVFAQLVLADEINRATPRTQSALLEAMQERTVTVAGQERALPTPFFVYATQNPIEMEGTYILPEAQIDRFFFKVIVGYPAEDVLDDVLRLTTGVEPQVPEALFQPSDLVTLQTLARAVPVATHVRQAVARFAVSTQPDRSGDDTVRRFVRFGVSPRGAQAWLLASKARALSEGRHNVAFADLRATLLPSLRHRLTLTFEGESLGHTPEAILSDLFDRGVARRS